MSELIQPFVSVVIPVFNDADRLKLCLKALEQQTYPKTLYEVVVVDNGSDEDISPIVRQFSHALATREPKPGSYAARNRGISLARGDVIAFTDSDCIPASDWLEKGVSNLLGLPNCGMVAGKIQLFFQNPDKPTAVELYESILAFPQKRYVESHYGATANIFTFKSVIDRVGLFNDTLKSSGDYEWGQRVYLAGYQQLYADDTCVNHPARYTLAQLHKKLARVMQGRYDLKKHHKQSLLRRYKKLVFRLSRDIMLPFRYAGFVYSHEKLANFQQKTKVFSIFFIRSYWKVLERLTLHFQG